MKSFAIKFYSFLAALVVCMGCLSIQSCKNNNAKTEDHDALAKFMLSFSDSTAFAIVDMGNTPVLLVSNETYMNGDEKNPELNAIAAQVFMLDESNKVICLGEIRSQGTLYPLSTDGKVLMSAGHRFVNCFVVEEDPQTMHLVESMYGQVVDPESVIYSYENRLENIFENSKDEASFEQMMNRFEDAKVIAFQKKLHSMTLWNRGRGDNEAA